MNPLDQHILDYFARNPNKGAGDVPPYQGQKIPRQTLTRRLTALVESAQLFRLGEGAGSRYAKGDVDVYLRIPVAQRPPAPFTAERITTALPKFSQPQLAALKRAAGQHGATAEDAARAVREQLLIELSYASSNLEGNTYDLLQTEALIRYGQEASGKSAFEAKMILNHRDAIRYLLDNIKSVAIDWTTLRDLHAMLSDGLLADDGDSGKIRTRIVTISQSAYQPLDNEFQLREAVTTLLDAVNAEPESFNQSLMLLTGVAYLQPFADCNKRTGRVLANLPLLLSSLPPLSFLTVDKEAYTRGLLTYYELGIGTGIAKAFADAYPASADAYKNNAEVKTRPHEQIGRELRYQSFVRQRLKDIILGETVRGAALPDSIPVDERSMVADMLRTQLESLHPGRAAPIGVSSAAIEKYLQRIEDSKNAAGMNGPSM